METKIRIAKLAKEPSTWAGVAAVLGGFSVLGLSEDAWMSLFGILMMAAGTVATVFLETGDKD